MTSTSFIDVLTNNFFLYSRPDAPEGLLEYGPPGFAEYGPPKGELNEEAKEVSIQMWYSANISNLNNKTKAQYVIYL